jgi:hypothetical protein
MVDYGTQYGALWNAAASVTGCGWRSTPCSNTNPASGYEAALNILRNADTPDDVGQAIVLMSDGEPVPYQSICSRKYLRNYRRGHYLFPLKKRCKKIGGYGNITDDVLEDWAEMARMDAEDAGIDTYSVFYGRNRKGSNFLRDHIRAGNGTHSVAPRADDIEETFLDICVQTTGGSAGMLF